MLVRAGQDGVGWVRIAASAGVPSSDSLQIACCHMARSRFTVLWLVQVPYPDWLGFDEMKARQTDTAIS